MAAPGAAIVDLTLDDDAAGAGAAAAAAAPAAAAPRRAAAAALPPPPANARYYCGPSLARVSQPKLASEGPQ